MMYFRGASGSRIHGVVVVNQTELAATRAVFDAIDSNGNGVVDVHEFEAAVHNGLIAPNGLAVLSDTRPAGKHPIGATTTAVSTRPNLDVVAAATQTAPDGAPAKQKAADGAPAKQTAPDGAPAKQKAANGAPAKQIAPDGASAKQKAADGAAAKQIAADGAPAKQKAADGAAAKQTPPGIASANNTTSPDKKVTPVAPVAETTPIVAAKARRDSTDLIADAEQLQRTMLASAKSRIEAAERSAEAKLAKGTPKTGQPQVPRSTSDAPAEADNNIMSVKAGGGTALVQLEQLVPAAEEAAAQTPEEATKAAKIARAEAAAVVAKAKLEAAGRARLALTKSRADEGTTNRPSPSTFADSGTSGNGRAGVLAGSSLLEDPRYFAPLPVLTGLQTLLSGSIAPAAGAASPTIQAGQSYEDWLASRHVAPTSPPQSEASTTAIAPQVQNPLCKLLHTVLNDLRMAQQMIGNVQQRLTTRLNAVTTRLDQALTGCGANEGSGAESLAQIAPQLSTGNRDILHVLVRIDAKVRYHTV